MPLLGAVFVLVYGECNQFTAMRTDVSSCYFEWERSLPFVPWLIVPYWSLDLFFCASFFLCATRAELRLLTTRLVAVVLASGVFYLLFPMKFGWDRPVPNGWTAPLFRALYANDLPFNLAPSLHISLRSILWVAIAARLRGWWRTVVKVWFVLIGVSTLLLWQHHFLDVATGFLMGWMIKAIIPARPRRREPATLAHRTMAFRTGLLAVVCSGIALCGGAWLWFAWPAVACGIVSLAYVRRDARLLGKENGTLSPAAEWCLLPWVLIARVVQHPHLGGQSAREITPGLLLGRRHTQCEAARLVATGPLAVLDLTAEGNAPHAFREKAAYCNIPLLDLVPPSDAAIEEAMKFIRTHHITHTVLVHCQLGLFRSATVLASWLVEAGLVKDHAAAVDLIRQQDPRVKL